MEIILVLLVGGVALAAVFYPLLRPDTASTDMDAAPAEQDPTPADVAPEAVLDADLARYRAAVRAGTVCARCRQAGPPGSRFCYECGKPVGADQPRPGEGDMD